MLYKNDFRAVYVLEGKDCHVCKGVDSEFVRRVFVLYITGRLAKRLGFGRHIISFLRKIRQ